MPSLHDELSTSTGESNMKITKVLGEIDHFGRPGTNR